MGRTSEECDELRRILDELIEGVSATARMMRSNDPMGAARLLFDDINDARKALEMMRIQGVEGATR